jgi:hypothetical protein
MDAPNPPEDLKARLSALSDRLAPLLTGDVAFRTIQQRLDAALGRRSIPVLPEIPDPKISDEGARHIVRELGRQENEYGFEGMATPADVPELPPIQDSERVLYQAERDAPILVGLCRHRPPIGEPLLDEYIRIQSSNSYVEYRTEAIYRVLSEVVKHPVQEWVRDRLPAIMSGVLAVNTVVFDEGVPLTVLALRAARNDAEGIAAFNAAWATADEGINKLGEERGRGDTLGHHRRRYAALAECLATLPLGIDPATGRVAQGGDQGPAKREAIRKLLTIAVRMPRGYAGYMAPTWETLAETARICRVEGEAVPWSTETWRDVLLRNAQASAHNIRDYRFCLRTTARINALRIRWWRPEGFDVRNSAARLAADPAAPEFSALHRIDEKYQWREIRRPDEALPSYITGARDFEALAGAYGRPAQAFADLNREPEPPVSDVDGIFELIRVPDNKLPTYLAARFSAEALVAPGLTARARARVLQQLAPVAIENPTALDTVLRRLLLASHTLIDDTTLDALAGVTTRQ